MEKYISSSITHLALFLIEQSRDIIARLEEQLNVELVPGGCEDEKELSLTWCMEKGKKRLDAVV